MIDPPVIKLPPVMLALALTVFAVITLAPAILPPDPAPVIKLPPVMLPVADINPPVMMLPPVILPLALSTPVTYSPVVANTATLPVPPTPTETLPPELTTVTLLVPLLIFATDVITPVNNAPLPKI